MQSNNNNLDRPLLIHEDQFFDERGKFIPSPLSGKWAQQNVSVSRRGTLRGMHFQKGEHAQAKLVRVLSGSVMDIVADLRKADKNPNNIPVYAYYLSSFNNTHNSMSLFVPKGFAHGFLALEDNTIFEYKVDAPYKPEAEGSIHWKSFGIFNEILIKHGLQEYELIVSEKDGKAPPLDSYINS
ncbi:MAG: dTDP-4-dehydrorhamnose 3,5-epimerase [Candidatus Spechtbacterales bacterium]